MAKKETKKIVMTRETELPEGWTKKPVGEVLNLINGRGFKQSEWRKSGVPIVRIQNLNKPDAPFNYYQGDLPEKHAQDNSEVLATQILSDNCPHGVLGPKRGQVLYCAVM